MLDSKHSGRKRVASIALGCVGLALISAVSAVNPRDAGRRIQAGEPLGVPAACDKQACGAEPYGRRMGNYNHDARYLTDHPRPDCRRAVCAWHEPL